MECEIENQTLPCEAIHIVGLGFGEWHRKIPVVNYSITVPLEKLATAFSDFYEDYAKDDQMYGSIGDDEEEEVVILAIRNKGWPSLFELALQEPELARDFVELVSYDALVALFPTGVYDERVQYLVNSIDRVELEKDRIRFSGMAYKFLEDQLGGNR